jgi:threonine dehydrogenase-like Zn-dependent dehydrogenase
VFALDREADRLALAERAGVLPIDVGARNVKTAVDAATGGRGADVVIDAVGHADAFASAIDVVRRGGRVTVLGMYTGERVDLPLGVWWARALDVRFAGICPVVRPHVSVRASSSDLTSLASVSLRAGFPDPMTREGRTVLRRIAFGRIRIRRMLAHPVRLSRLARLLSVA